MAKYLTNFSASLSKPKLTIKNIKHFAEYKQRKVSDRYKMV